MSRDLYQRKKSSVKEYANYSTTADDFGEPVTESCSSTLPPQITAVHTDVQKSAGSAVQDNLSLLREINGD
jgi:hypothetical protein